MRLIDAGDTLRYDGITFILTGNGYARHFEDAEDRSKNNLPLLKFARAQADIDLRGTRTKIWLVLYFIVIFEWWGGIHE